MTNKLRVRQLGERTAEYFLLIALIAMTALGLYKAFGSVVRGQTLAAASSLAGVDVSKGKTSTSDLQTTALVKPKGKAFNYFEK